MGSEADFKKNDNGRGNDGADHPNDVVGREVTKAGDHLGGELFEAGSVDIDVDIAHKVILIHASKKRYIITTG